MKVLVTGGAGYIGSHTCLELLESGHDVFVIDNLCNGNSLALDRVEQISNHEIGFIEADIRDNDALDRGFDIFGPEVVIHLAGLKAINESVMSPLHYYDVNVGGTISLLEAMDRHGCENIVFSSSATVYGDPDYLPYDELHQTCPVNPYGRTKLMAENILHDWTSAISSPPRRAISLRYFNPVGAHESGQIGEHPLGVPTNLMPYMAQVATGRLDYLKVFGSDYETRDGTGVRDYIHVVDLARAHLAAIEQPALSASFEVINLGSGCGTTVLELLNALEVASNKQIKYKFTDRRPGDLASSWADPSKSAVRLNWKTFRGIDEMCVDTWRWQKNNPTGYI